MPDILEGYCNKSDKPREEAEKEAMEFLNVIEDASSYMFGYNHSIAYCLLGYLCAYYRYHNKIEFITSFLNNAANDDDIRNATKYAKKYGIDVTMPKWGISRSDYAFDKEKNVIAKGLSSIKHMSKKNSDMLYKIAHEKKYETFIDVLLALKNSPFNSRQIDILVKIDFFSEFGNQNELLRIIEMFNDTFKSGDVKKINRNKVRDLPYLPEIEKFSIGTTKSGSISTFYTMLDNYSAMKACERVILDSGLPDLDDLVKVKNFTDAMGYVGYVSGKQEDRKKLYVLDFYELHRKVDGKLFGYSFITKSIGSGVESRFTVFCDVYDRKPFKKGDILVCTGWKRNKDYDSFVMLSYNILDSNTSNSCGVADSNELDKFVRGE